MRPNTDDVWDLGSLGAGDSASAGCGAASGSSFERWRCGPERTSKARHTSSTIARDTGRTCAANPPMSAFWQITLMTRGKPPDAAKIAEIASRVNTFIGVPPATRMRPAIYEAVCDRLNGES